VPLAKEAWSVAGKPIATYANSVEGKAMDAREKLIWAIENSVHWYDALCEAHALPGEHHPAFWINRSTLPPYMSNVITPERWG